MHQAEDRGVQTDPQAEQQEIARICRLVDGIPLALELAAAWLKVLSCAEVAQEIENGMDILVARHQNIPVRHRSMSVMLDQSWQLSVRGPTCTPAPPPSFGADFCECGCLLDISSDLAELVDKSWFTAPGRRYQIMNCCANMRPTSWRAPQQAAQERHMTFIWARLAGMSRL
jgi:hypothetical protein